MYRKYVKPAKWGFAKSMRKRPTKAEQTLRTALRLASKGKYRWLSQHLCLGWILDIYCGSVRVAVEIDGSSHDKRKVQDRTRDAVLRDRCGIITLRFKNEDVIANTMRAVDDVLRFCDGRPKIERKR